MKVVVVLDVHNPGLRECGCLVIQLLISMSLKIGQTSIVVIHCWPLSVQSRELLHSHIHHVLVRTLQCYDPIIHLVLAHPSLVNVQGI